MKELSDNFYRKMFALGALWNLAIGLTGLVAADFAVTLFFGSAAVTDNFLALLMLKVVMLAIIIFGIGYYLVSLSLQHNRGLIWLGMLSKLILFSLFGFYFFQGQVAILGFLAVCGDVLWSIGFLAFLWQTRSSVSINQLVG